jgi:thiol-disulfide isomerase/thioredoxin
MRFRVFSLFWRAYAMQAFVAGFASSFRPPRRILGIVVLTAVVVGSSSLAKHVVGAEPQGEERKAPELAGIAQWSNSAGLTVAGQQGKVLVVHFWAFSCINCKRNLPKYNQWRKDFPESKVQIIGVHTPETADEADLNNVASQVKKLGIKYPVAADNQGATWKAYENQMWPTVYVIDKQGRIRYRWQGELEYKKAGGDRIVRAKIKELLAEEQ